MSIPVNKEGGIEPHLIRCSKCHGDNGLSIGVMMQTEYEGHTIYANRGQTHKVTDKHGYPLTNWSHVPVDQATITMGICPTCEDEINKLTKEVADGGVLFRCKECEAEGVIVANSSIADAARKATGIPAPEPVGITFEHCMEHGGKRVIN